MYAILCVLAVLFAIGLSKYLNYLERRKLITACKVLAPEMTIYEASNALRAHHFQTVLRTDTFPKGINFSPSTDIAWSIGPLNLFISNGMSAWKPYPPMRVTHGKSFHLFIMNKHIITHRQDRIVYAGDCENVRANDFIDRSRIVVE